MKTIMHLISLAATFSVASATAVPAAGGYINTFKVTNCVQASLSVTDSTNTPLTQNICAKIATFLSFNGGKNSPCPKGQTAKILAYETDNCSGGAVSSGPLAATTSPSACQDIIASDFGSGVKAGGHSAEFICVA